MEGMTPQVETLHISGSMVTHVGLVRSGNEDAVAFTYPRRTDPGASLDLLALVADGMGGHAAGEVASRMAADVIMDRLAPASTFSPLAMFEAIMAANAAVFAQSRSNPHQSGMGTTLTVIAVQGLELYLGHVGDSRAYVINGGVTTQLSLDHSLVADLVSKGAITEAEAAVSPHRNVITQALGRRETLTPQVYGAGFQLQDGDVVLLCSDGVTDLVSTASLAELVVRAAPADACSAIVSAALAAGGHDNVSVGVFAFCRQAPPKTEPRTTQTMPAVNGAGRAA